jgi:hypothetical protein
MKSKHTKDLETVFTIFIIVMMIDIPASFICAAAALPALPIWGTAFPFIVAGASVLTLILGDILFPALINSSKAADRFNAMFPEPKAAGAVPPDPRIAQLKEAIKDKEKTIAQAILLALDSEGVISKEDEANYQKIIDTLPLE